MKKLFVASRAIKFSNGTVHTQPICVFTDKADAERAVSEVPQMIAGAHPGVHQAFALCGIGEVGGRIDELPYVAGAGLVLPDSDKPVVGLFSKE